MVSLFHRATINKHYHFERNKHNTGSTCIRNCRLLIVIGKHKLSKSSLHILMIMVMILSSVPSLRAFIVSECCRCNSSMRFVVSVSSCSSLSCHSSSFSNVSRSISRSCSVHVHATIFLSTPVVDNVERLCNGAKITETSYRRRICWSNCVAQR